MFEQFQQLPKSMKVLMGAMAGTTIVGIAAMIDYRAVVILVVGILLIALAVFAWSLVQKARNRKRARILTGQLSANSAVAPKSIADPARRARLDDLRQNFFKGLEKYRAAGKDLYSLPWYIACGEPGSGKTEAIRHCAVGFPPGLQDEMQGAGGTLNMHWWFTNQAVILDTAGKLLFQEAPAGTTTEWTEFLGLLRKARPTCPINGLLLIIPSESLVRDSMEEIHRKAGRIAQQLDQIQKSLDVRFPVFVLITKCDLINGFREFFAGLKDPSLQHQMTGWSNPDSLDSIFRPEAVDEHLSNVVNRIRRRRLGLLKDPVATDVGVRRLDEVDALFALPASIAALAPRLRKYLETMFVAGEWSAKPLFLRGIYFTSALTEGSALDAELAAALGMPVESLPDGKAWERERSFFLRDLFLQKIFREKGLVTRATNTRQLVLRRQIIVGGAAGLGLFLLVLFTFLGRRALRLSIGEELAIWRAGADSTAWAESRWHPLVNGRGEFVGNDPVVLDDGRTWPIVEFHDRVQQRVASDLRIPWVFKPVEAVAIRANPNRRRAQQALFEASVIGPIVDANRKRLLDASGTWTTADAGRLAGILQLEGAVQLREVAGYIADYPAEDFFPPLLGPSLAGKAGAESTLDRLMKIYEWTYFRGGSGKGKWPENWLANGSSLRENEPIERGVEAFEKFIKEAQVTQHGSLQTVSDAREAAIRFLNTERGFIKAAIAVLAPEEWQHDVEQAWSKLSAAQIALDALILDLRHKTNAPSDLTLGGQAKAIVDSVRLEIGRGVQPIRAALLRQRAAAEAATQSSSGPGSQFTLYRDVLRQLSALESQVNQGFDQTLSPSDRAQLPELDLTTLRPITGGVPAYTARSRIYEGGVTLLKPPVESTDTIFGKLASTVNRYNTSIASLRDQTEKYDGPQRAEFTGDARRFLDTCYSNSFRILLTAYKSEFERTFPAAIGLPLGPGPTPLTGAEFRSAFLKLDKLHADTAAQGLPADLRQNLEPSLTRGDLLWGFASGLAGAEGESQPIKIVLLRDRDQAATIERVLGASNRRKPLGRVYPSMRIGGRDFRVRGLAENVEVAKLPASELPARVEFSVTPDPKDEPDAFTPLGPWGILRLIQEGSIRRAEGKEWDTVLRVPDREGELVLAITVVFEKPLPLVEKWPAIQKRR